MDAQLVYPAPLFVRNTFLDCMEARPPSLEEFLQERLVKSCPTSGVSDTGVAQQAPPGQLLRKAACGARQSAMVAAETDNTSECSTTDTAAAVAGAGQLPRGDVVVLDLQSVLPPASGPAAAAEASAPAGAEAAAGSPPEAQAAAEAEAEAEEGDEDAWNIPVLVFESAQELKSSDEPLRLRHAIDGKPTPVLKVEHVGAHESDQVVTFVTLARDGCYLWSLKGHLLMKLTVQKHTIYYNVLTGKADLAKPDIQVYDSLACVNKDAGSLILVSGGGFTATWAFEDGLVFLPNFRTLDRYERMSAWEKAMGKFQEKGDCPVPTAVYHRPGNKIDVDQEPLTTKFAAELDLQSPRRVVLWNLLAIEPQKLAVHPPGPAGLMIMPGRDKIMMTLRHSAKVWSLRVVEDPGGTNEAAGAAVFTGCEDGTIYGWDVDGKDARQVYTQLRSMTYFETFLPPILIVVTSIQIMTFAFGPTVPWKKEVHTPAVMVHKIAVMDFKFKFAVHRDMIFWAEVVVALGSMLFFIIFAMCGGVKTMDRLVHFLQDTWCFKSETRRSYGPCHLTLMMLRKIRAFMNLAMQLCSTVLVVPMLTVCAQSLDCESLECNAGPHRKLQIVLLFVLPAYFFVLVPYAAVGGDPGYVPRSTLFDYKIWEPENMWRKAARRKATDMYLGFLHQTPAQAFNTPFCELIAKCTLPFLTTDLSSHPLLQMVMISAVGTGIFIQGRCFPAYIEEKFLVLVQDLQFLTMGSMLIGLLVVVLDRTGQKQAIFPVALLSVLVLLVLCHLIYKLMTTQIKRNDVVILRARISKQAPAESVSDSRTEEP
mmetsp:Transcript_125718/g.391491  ORF Transcript_125718/g.391491 Transcript_125718/m.391491 type:complete len:819 (+) Transcript_125718:126-2582(+)